MIACYQKSEKGTEAARPGGITEKCSQFYLSFSAQSTLKEGLFMKKESKSRREALELLGKTGLFLGSVPVFFTSLKINPLSESNLSNDFLEAPLTDPSIVEEKAFISGSGSSLTVKVTGNPGRVIFVTFASTDVRENYRRVSGSNGVINARGSGSVVINTKNIPNTKVYLKVMTGEPNNVKSGLRETGAFMITLKEGIMQTFDGTVGRPIVESKWEASQTLIAMAAATQDKRILLR
jgi:hypothetical protein